MADLFTPQKTIMSSDSLGYEEATIIVENRDEYNLQARHVNG